MTGVKEDPIVTSSRRELALVMAMVVVAAVYTVSYCALFGYGRSADSLSFVLWFPDWVFWGIVAPWVLCAAFSSYFALRIMDDAPLEDETRGPSPAESSEERRG
jgi:hypothetical protein